MDKKYLRLWLLAILFPLFTIHFSLFTPLFAQSSQTEYEEFIEVFAYSPNEEHFIPYVKRELAEAIVKFQHTVMNYPDISLSIHIAPNRQTYESWIINKHIVFENSLAFADIETNRIFVKHPSNMGDNRAFIRVLLHEYIHLFVRHHWIDAPLWFQEGMAIYFSDGISFGLLSQFMANNSLHREYLLRRYAYSYPENRANIEPYYFQTALILRKIVEYDMDKLIDLFEISNRYRGFSDCFRASFGITQEEYLDSFEGAIDEFYKLNIYKGIMMLTWVSFPVILIIARITKRYKTRKILAQWEMEEQTAEDIHQTSEGVPQTTDD